MENYEIWDRHGERSTEARAFMMHDDVIREDFDGGGGGDGDDDCDDGEGYGGQDDDGEDNNEEEEDFLEDMLLNMEKELLLKGLKNLEGVKKARKECLYLEEQGCEKRWSLCFLNQTLCPPTHIKQRSFSVHLQWVWNDYMHVQTILSFIVGSSKT